MGGKGLNSRIGGVALEGRGKNGFDSQMWAETGLIGSTGGLR